MPSCRMAIRTFQAEDIPAPAAGGGGSSSFREPLLRRLATCLPPRRANERETVNVASWRGSSRDFSAAMMSSTRTTAPLANWRNDGEFSTENASDTHEASKERLSSILNSRSLKTSSGCTNKTVFLTADRRLASLFPSDQRKFSEVRSSLSPATAPPDDRAAKVHAGLSAIKSGGLALRLWLSLGQLRLVILRSKGGRC
jgi:hypothetical protein